MKQNLKKWLNTILILIAVTVLGVSIYVTRRKTIQLDEPSSNGEVSMVEEEREQGVVDVQPSGEVQETTEVQIDNSFNPERPRNGLTQVLPYSYPETKVTQYIKEVFGDNPGFALSLANCESTLNPNAVSPSGTYIGLFQFSEVTWNEQCSGDIFNYIDQTDCTKKLIDKGEIWRWPTCGR